MQKDFSEEFERNHPIVSTGVYLAQALVMVILVFLMIVGVGALLFRT